jgi:hypothetical protein
LASLFRFFFVPYFQVPRGNHVDCIKVRMWKGLWPVAVCLLMVDFTSRYTVSIQRKWYHRKPCHQNCKIYAQYSLQSSGTKTYKTSNSRAQF